ncbi:MAG: DNA repair protein RecO [Actinomycetaceae bacterium]|nr:DNA repair protein RecO [Actinomycetaceae bacterium]
MLKTYRDQGVVLRHYKLGEADRIIVVLTKNHGQVRAVAKGVRRTTSRLGARVEPLNVIDAQFYRGRGDLDTLTQAEIIAPVAHRLSSDYTAFTHAQVMVDLAEKLSGSDIDSAHHYELLYGALGALGRREHRAEYIMVAYALRCLSVAGWPPRLDICGKCQAQQPSLTPSSSAIAPGGEGSQQRVQKILDWFSIAGGGAYCQSCHPLDAIAIEPAQLNALHNLLHARWQCVVPLQQHVIDTVIHYAQWYVEHRLKSIDVLAQGA